MPRIARRATVHGTVQGVFFRDSTRREAERHGVVGWVRNDADGTVTAQLEGERSGVEQVLAWIRAGGPREATVERLDVDEVAPGGASSFEIRG